MVVKPSQLSKEQMPSSPVQLSALAGYQKFGDYLRLKRKQFGLLQREMAELFSLTPSMYGFLERERRAPQIEELVPMFVALVQLQSDKRLPSMQVIEAETFFRLGKMIIEKKEKKRPNVTQQEWDAIEQQLINLVDHHQRNQVHLVSGEIGTSSTILEPLNSRRRTALNAVLKTDLSHLLERETWVQRVLTYPDRVPQIKVSVVQAGMGAGKSHALALLAQHLAKRDDLFSIPYMFKHSETITPDDHLDEFLATLHADLTMRVTDEAKQRPLAERIDQVLSAIREHNQKVIMLLDDAQEMFPSAGEWSTSWHQFFASFISEPHGATLYMMSRTWPGWDERKRSFWVEEDLPDLSVTSGIQLWKRLGYDDVDDDLLKKVCERCGQNPQAIEMLAFQNKRRGFSINWKGSRSYTNENPHSSSLKKLLESETLFSANLDEASRKTLQQVFTNRLSGEDVKLLECLALAPLGIPFDLLVEQFDFAAQSYEKLVHASFADLSIATSGRAAVVPLVREAMVQSLTGQRKNDVEMLVSDLYTHWLKDVQDFKDDSEKAALIAEMVVRYIRTKQLLKAAEMFIGYGWLCSLFGHIARIQRVYEEMVRTDRGKEEDAGQEVGKLLLRHRLQVAAGHKVTRSERDDMYQYIYTKLLAGEMALQPHSELTILHNMRLFYSKDAQYTEANQMFNSAFERLQQSGQLTPEASASFFYNRAQLFLSWSEKYEQRTFEAHHYMQIATETLKECIAQWRMCLKNALPMQEHYIKFELARVLNDYAYALRILRILPEAQKAIEESIQLKRANAALVHSLAISLSERSQILLPQGKLRLALDTNEEAIQILELAVEQGDTAHRPELGMLLVERANILWHQARLKEAKPLLERAIALIGDKPSRQQDKHRAIEQLAEIQRVMGSGRPYRLDRRWFTHYSELVTYDDLHLLTQAGLFTEDEQNEFALLSHQSGDDARDRMLELAGQSRKREFVRSQQDQYVPNICYPFIQVDNVQERIHGLKDLRTEIETQEQHAIVRHLYLSAIDEHLTILRLIEATALHDQDAVWECNLKLYGKPSEHELKIALQALCTTLLCMRDDEQAGPIVQDIITQLQAWGISAYDIVAEELFISQPKIDQQVNHKILKGEKKQFSAKVAQKFFEDVLKDYGAQDWEVLISPARDHTYVDPNVRKLVLPQKSFTVAKIRQLLAEEIETHTFRALAGQRTSLALLGLGLARQEATEEGLAKWYVRRVNRQVGTEDPENTWIGTLSSGLACGILTPTLSFQELRRFLEKYYHLRRLLTREETQEEALNAAKQLAWARVCRTFRGVPDLAQPGCCSLKDRIYLSGYLEISHYFENGNNDHHLYVGAIGIEHLEDMAELNILIPNFPNHQFALALDLVDRLAKYEA